MANLAEPEVVELDPVEVTGNIEAIVTESKAGYKTTEFWITLVVTLLGLVQAYPVPDWVNGAIVALASASYVISRGLAKQGIPAVEPLP